MLANVFRSCRLLAPRVLNYNGSTALRTLTSSGPSQYGLSLQYKDDIAVITMDNGENRINTGFIQEFLALLDVVESTAESRALITTGCGKNYSLGADLVWIAQQKQRETIVDYVCMLNVVMHRLLYFPLPTMAVINGHCFAGGFILALAHDMRTMNVEKGWLCLNEVLIDVPIAQFLITFAKTKIGQGLTASDTVLLGQRYNSHQATEKGLIHAAYPPSSLMDSSVELLNRKVPEDGIPRETLRAMKKALYLEASNVFDKENGADFSKSDIAKQTIDALIRKGMK